MEKRIIIIDDDKDILEALKDLLEMEGYRVQTIPRGDNALEGIFSFKPHAILLDLLLSGKDGITICHEVRENVDTKELPIIMMSAHPLAKKTIEGSGASEFLRKPFDVEELLSLIKKHVPGN
jgi:DNA-binding response OmpR family regulator